ncbi:MAG: glycosyltransferase family 1 protein [Deltaproteobacteria bacterium]|nr:MAG: glycosyltransferase family 1 protein [Deltaproteobacteria bacterium]
MTIPYCPYQDLSELKPTTAFSDNPARPLRIVHLESSRNIGGQELRILAQMEWLISNGHMVWLMAHPGTPIMKEAAKRELPSVPVAFRGSLHPKAIWAVLRFAYRNLIDIIDCHSTRDAAVAMVAKLSRRRVVRSQHIGRQIKNDILHKLMWQLGNHVVIATSASIKEQIVRQGLSSPEKIYVVPPGIHLDRFNPQVDGGAVRKAYGIDDKAKLITLIGMIRRDKGQRFLVRAVDLIVAAIPDAYFMIVGSATHPEYLEDLKKEISRIQNMDRVILAGFQENVEHFIAASDLIAITSLMEARSLAVMQAFAMKKVVVASRVGGIPEIVHHGKTGFLYPPGNAEKLAGQIIFALTNDVSEIVENAYSLAQREFSFDAMMEKTLSVYRLAMGI